MSIALALLLFLGSEATPEPRYELEFECKIRVRERVWGRRVELDQWAPVFSGGEGWPIDEQCIDPMGVNGPLHSKPVIMAVQGYCFTWGVEMLLNTEIRVAADNTVFQMLEVQRGLYPCGGATFRLPREVGWGNAQRVLLTGERWSAEEALRWGMVQELTEPGAELDRAMELATAVAKAAKVKGIVFPRPPISEIFFLWVAT